MWLLVVQAMSGFRLLKAKRLNNTVYLSGMGYLRGSKADYDAWENLGNPGWGWKGLLPYFRKSTTFTPPTPEAASRWNITWDLSVYGKGPMQITIPDFRYPDIATFWTAWRGESGIPIPRDIGDGSGPGAYWTPSTLDRRDATRATSRKGYYDPIFSNRPNLHLVTGQTAKEILFDGLTANGVLMVSRADNSSVKVYARKEVILAAGAIQTPQILQVSGIGPKELLRAAGIAVKKDMPAVGANFQDHPTSVLVHTLSNQTFPSPESIANNATYNATVWEEYLRNHTGPIASSLPTMFALLSLPMVSISASSIAKSLLAQDALQYLPSVYSYPPLLAGFKEQRKALAKAFMSNDSATSSFVYPGNGVNPSILLKPTSRGTITINTTNPHGLPVVQFNTFMNPLDSDIIIASIRRTRAYWKRSEFQRYSPVEISPGAQYQTDAELLLALTTKGAILPSLAHPCGSCAMMPEALGGCVGPDLRVHGVQRLSIVDASVLPLIPGGPLQATIYAVGEKAADLIRDRA
jgi:choline dehydrogenase-like flavoprotein